jgi:hypothetical protein
VCSGCGEGPEDLARIDAISITTFLERRFASLLANPEHSLRYRGPGRGSWSAMEPAVKVAEALGAADNRLRDLLGEETTDRVPVATEPQRSVPSRQTVSAVFADLAENVSRLTETIAGATSEDWRRREPHDGATAGEIVWLALHGATHHLEDAELLLDAACARGKEPRPATGLYSLPVLDETDDG